MKQTILEEVNYLLYKVFRDWGLLQRDWGYWQTDSNYIGIMVCYSSANKKFKNPS